MQSNACQQQQQNTLYSSLNKNNLNTAKVSNGGTSFLDNLKNQFKSQTTTTQATVNNSSSQINNLTKTQIYSTNNLSSNSQTSTDMFVNSKIKSNLFQSGLKKPSDTQRSNLPPPKTKQPTISTQAQNGTDNVSTFQSGSSTLNAHSSRLTTLSHVTYNQSSQSKINSQSSFIYGENGNRSKSNLNNNYNNNPNQNGSNHEDGYNRNSSFKDSNIINVKSRPPSIGNSNQNSSAISNTQNRTDDAVDFVDFMNETFKQELNSKFQE
jgi:hypothetical protein